MRKILVVLAAALLCGPLMGGEVNAKVVRVAGKAEIFRAGVWNEAKTGDSLKPGEAVRIADGGEVNVEGADGKISLNGRNGAVIEYDGIVDAEIAPWKSARLARAPGYQPQGDLDATQQFSCPAGDIEIRVQTGEPLRVVTPLLTAAVRGTEFTMQVAPDGSSSLQLLQGAVDGYDRTGTMRQVAPGQDMSLDTSAFVQYLGAKGVDIMPGQDWRTLSPTVLESVDAATFSGTFAQVYYNPVVGRVVKSEAGTDGVDEGKVAKAAYVGDATLEDILANPDVDPMAPDWAEDLSATPMTEAESGHMAAVYEPGLGNTVTSPAVATQPAGDAALPSGPDGFDSSLVNGGTPSDDLAGGIAGSTSTATAQVRGTLSGTMSSIATGTFGFDVNLGSGDINNGTLKGDGLDNTMLYPFHFNLHSGTGSYSATDKDFYVDSFQGTINGLFVGDIPMGGGASLSGTAPNGLGQIGDTVGGNFTVNEGPFFILNGTFSGSQVNDR